MASEVVRAAVSSLLEQKEYHVNTPRNITALETAKTLLEVTSANANLTIFDAFAQKLVDNYKIFTRFQSLLRTYVVLLSMVPVC